jgi:F-type H+-transporting ATPase subunit delta
MQNVSVARRYARALLDASADQADVVLSQLDELVRYLHTAPEVLSVLSNPALSRAQRMTMTEGVIKAADGMHLTLANTLRLLTDRNRFSSLPGLALQFRELVDLRMGHPAGRRAAHRHQGAARDAHPAQGGARHEGRPVDPRRHRRDGRQPHV